MTRTKPPFRFLLFLALLSPLGCQSNTPRKDLQAPAGFLRYGNRTPAPTSRVEEILQRGQFSKEVKKLGKKNVNAVYLGTLNYDGESLTVIIKPERGLYAGTIRDDIAFQSDNRNADAAFHVSRFIDLVDTPAHIIRDDAPVDESGTKKGPAGIQVFIDGSTDPSKEIRALIQKDPKYLNELEEIAIYDTLIGNTDRHGNNFRFRAEPESKQRHIVAIDQSLAFPLRDSRWKGNYKMILWYLQSSRKGAISPANLAKLKAFLAKKDQLQPILALNINPVAIELLWKRAETMIKTKKVFLP